MVVTMYKMSTLKILLSKPLHDTSILDDIKSDPGRPPLIQEYEASLVALGESANEE